MKMEQKRKIWNSGILAWRSKLATPVSWIRNYHHHHHHLISIVIMRCRRCGLLKTTRDFLQNVGNLTNVPLDRRDFLFTCLQVMMLTLR